MRFIVRVTGERSDHSRVDSFFFFDQFHRFLLLLLVHKLSNEREARLFIASIKGCDALALSRNGLASHSTLCVSKALRGRGWQSNELTFRTSPLIISLQLIIISHAFTRLNDSLFIGCQQRRHAALRPALRRDGERRESRRSAIGATRPTGRGIDGSGARGRGRAEFNERRWKNFFDARFGSPPPPSEAKTNLIKIDLYVRACCIDISI